MPTPLPQVGWTCGAAILPDDVDEPWSTDFDGVDYCKVDVGFGFANARITKEADIDQILSEAIANPRANFIEFIVPLQDKIVPFVPGWVRAARAKNLPHFY